MERPRSSSRTLRPFSVSSFAAQPPEMPEPMTIASKSCVDIGSTCVEPVHGARKPGLRPVAWFHERRGFVLRRCDVLAQLGRGPEFAGVVTENREPLHEDHEGRT